MAKNRIKGITVEIGGDTTGLDKALSGVNKEIRETQSQLKDVERLLKLDPKNTELLAQQQKLLAKAVTETSTKLDSLKSAEKQVQQQFKEGKVSQDQYDALKREIAATEISLNKYEQELEQVGDAAKSSDTAMDKLEKNIDDVGDSANSADDKIDDMNKTLKSDVYMEVADQIGEISDKLGELGGKAMDAFNESNAATTKATAYFGETGEAAEQTANLIKDVFNSGVGDSMDAVSEAVITVKKNLKDLDEATMKNITEQAIMLDETFGIDMNETLRGVNSLMQNFGMDAQTAMDYVVKGTQNGLDKTNELGDNLAEYSGKFAQAGYSADEYFQLLNNGLDGGAYNLDKVNDAINEVTTRLADGTIADSMDAIDEKTGEVIKSSVGWGDSVQDVFAKWQNGGASQKEVVEAMVADIQNTTGEQDKLNKAALAFGTMGEDGSLQFIESLTSVGTAYGDVGGAAQGMFEQTTTPAQEMESNMRKIQEVLQPLGEKLMEIANTVLPPLVDGIKWIADLFASLPEPVQNFMIIFGGLLVVLGTVAPIIATITTAMTLLNIPLLPIIGIVAAIAAGIALVIIVFQNWGAIVDWFGGVFEAIGAFIGSVWDSIKSAFTTAIEALSGAMSSFGDFLKGIWDKITGVFKAFDNFLQGVFSTDWSKSFGVLGDLFNAFFANVSNIWSSIKQVFSGIINFIKGVFTGNWKQAWEGIKSIFSGVFNGLISIVKAPLNGVIGLLNGAISGINWLISGLNQISFSLPDWVPFGLGGKSFGINIGQIGKIPYLAKGGVLSQGNAVVGEAGPELLSMVNGSAVVQPLTNSVANTTNNNMGSPIINVYGAPGQSERALAQLVADEFEHMKNSKGAVYA